MVLRLLWTCLVPHRKRPASASPGAIRKRPAAEVAVHPAAPGAPMASGNRYSMEYNANHISCGFKDKTSKKQVMQVTAKKLSRATVESIAQKVFAELNAGASVADAKEMARALKEAHSLA